MVASMVYDIIIVDLFFSDVWNCIFRATLHSLLLVCALFMFRYASGDHVAIQPVNNSDMVDEIGRRLNVNLDTVMSLVAEEGNSVCVYVSVCLSVCACVCACVVIHVCSIHE